MIAEVVQQLARLDNHVLRPGGEAPGEFLRAFADGPSRGLMGNQIIDAARSMPASAISSATSGVMSSIATGPEAEQFEMAFAPRFRLALAALGVTPATAHVIADADRLVARFGPWVCRTKIGAQRVADVGERG